jgi:hypothetical protein
MLICIMMMVDMFWILQNVNHHHLYPSTLVLVGEVVIGEDITDGMILGTTLHGIHHGIARGIHHGIILHGIRLGIIHGTDPDIVVGTVAVDIGEVVIMALPDITTTICTHMEDAAVGVEAIPMVAEGL